MTRARASTGRTRRDFAAFILTYGRPDSVMTYNTLRSHGYTGAIYLVVDDEDAALPAYRARFGAPNVLTFSKAAVAHTFDEGDNTRDRRSVVYARNASWDLAAALGLRAFVQLDDDFQAFSYRFDADRRYAYLRCPSVDVLLAGLVAFLERTPFLSVALSQGGDHIGGRHSHWVQTITGKRKAMNTFVCLTARRFTFPGRINEDVNAYTAIQRNGGGAFLTFMMPQVVQRNTQRGAGGMTDLYHEGGTYLKSFYSVMFAPSCVRVAYLRDPAHGSAARIHHRIRWECAAPMILPESVRRGPRARRARHAAS